MKIDDSYEKTGKKLRDKSSNNQVSGRDLSDDSSDTSPERIQRNVSPIRPRSPCKFNDREDTRRIYDRVDHYYNTGARPYRSRGYSRGDNYGHQYYGNRSYNESGRGGYDGRYVRSYGNEWYVGNNRTPSRGYPGSNRGYYRGYGPQADNGFNRSYENGYGRYNYDSRRGGYRGRGRYETGPREYHGMSRSSDHMSRSYQNSFEYPSRYGQEYRRWNNYSEHALFKRRDDRYFDPTIVDRREYMASVAAQERYRPRNDSRDEFMLKSNRGQFRIKEYSNEKYRYKDDEKDDYYSKDLPEAYRQKYDHIERKRKHYDQHDNRYSRSSSHTPENSPKRYRSRSPGERIEKNR